MTVAPYRFTDWGGTRTAIVIGTGPSLKHAGDVLLKQVTDARSDGVFVFGVNNVFLSRFPLDGFFANNPEWWDYYGNSRALRTRIEEGMQAWTWSERVAETYGVSWIPGRWSGHLPGARRRVCGLSSDPSFIHYGHGSGYEVLNVAYHCGIRRMLLVGYDLRYPPRDRRHYFGEYPVALRHYPKTGPDGEMTGLLDIYETIDTRALGLEIVNCTPGSALKRFPFMDIQEALSL